jgi:hypothetical protein
MTIVRLLLAGTLILAALLAIYYFFGTEVGLITTGVGLFGGSKAAKKIIEKDAEIEVKKEQLEDLEEGRKKPVEELTPEEEQDYWKRQ